jgi:hypothetical protein
VRLKVKLSEQLDLLTEEHWRALFPDHGPDDLIPPTVFVHTCSRKFPQVLPADGRLVFECCSPRCTNKGRFRRARTLSTVADKIACAHRAGRSEVVID